MENRHSIDKQVYDYVVDMLKNAPRISVGSKIEARNGSSCIELYTREVSSSNKISVSIYGTDDDGKKNHHSSETYEFSNKYSEKLRVILEKIEDSQNLSYIRNKNERVLRLINGK